MSERDMGDAIEVTRVRGDAQTGVMEPIAIIGVGCRFPGGVDSVDKYWKLLLDGVDAIRETPKERWSLDSFYDPERSMPGKAVARWGGFLDQVTGFDAGFFKISPREANNLDPQQRLLLEVAWEALEDAGKVPSSLRGSATGVFVGGFTLDYKVLQFGGDHFHNLNTHTAVGTMMTMLSNRISYAFDLRGPSLSIDTACSSSLIAIHTACQSLRNGDCSLALAGGSLLILTPQYTIAESQGGFLSVDGRCKAFDSRANGYVRGEGVGLVLLKPLSAAIADNDPIYAVIRGSAINQDGNSNGITVPRQEAQEEAIRRACQRAGISPGQLSYVEAHGTGTPVGDPIEARALSTVLATDRAPGRRCWVGSVKTNIGHLEAASGIAGLIKATLCLQHRQVPRNLHFLSPNPAIDFENSCIRVPTAVEPLEGDGQSLYAGVNSFGFGGTNGHVVLEEYVAPRPQPSPSDAPNGPRLVPVSARSEAALRRAALELSSFVESAPPGSVSLHDVGYTASRLREHHALRLAVVADSTEGLSRALQLAADSFAAPKAREGEAGIVFVFSGMGPQWWAMGRQLLETEPVFQRVIEQCDREMRKYVDWSLLEELTAAESDSHMSETRISQPANFALQIALSAVLRSWGVAPAAIVGHSTGEVAACYEAGVLSLEDAVRVIIHRSRLQHTLTGTGKMAAVGLSKAEALELLVDYGDRLSLAAVNSHRSVTVAGDADALSELGKALEAKQVFFRMLRVEIPFHSAKMDRIRDELLANLAGLRPREPHTPLYSTVTGTRASAGDWDAAYWWRNVRQSVLFADAIETLLQAGYRNFLELGPHPVVSGSVSELMTARGVSGTVQHSLKRGEDERRRLLDVLASLYATGGEVRWDLLYPEGRFVRLPHYPWQREHHWNETSESQRRRLGDLDHRLLGRRLSTPIPEWESEIRLQRLPWLSDHAIGEQILYPGAAYIEMALQALKHSYGSAVTLEGIRFHRAVFLSASSAPLLRLRLNPDAQRFEIHSLALEDGKSSLHASGSYRKLQGGLTAPAVALAELKSRCPTRVLAEDCYAELRKLGFCYGAEFQGIRELWLGPSEAVARIEPLAEHSSVGPASDYELSPVLLDACFQALITIQLGTSAGQFEQRLPVGIDRLRSHRPLQGALWAHAVIRRDTGRELIGDIRLYSEEGCLLAEVIGFRAQALDAQLGRISNSEVESCLYQLSWQQAQEPREPARDVGRGGRWLVFADRAGISQRVVELAARRGVQCIQVVRGETHGAVDPGDRLTLGEGSEEDWARLASALANDAVDHVLHFWNLDADDATRVDRAGLERSYQDGLVSVLKLTQRLVQSGLGTKLWLFSRGAFAVEPQDPPPNFLQAPVWGFARVLGHQESVNLLGAVIDLDPRAELDPAPMIVERVLDPSGEEQQALRGTRYYHPRLGRTPDHDATLPSRFRDDAAYLITGAFGALGQLVARWMVERGARHLVCLGHTPLPERSSWPATRDPVLLERIRFVRELEASGASVHSVAVDLADEAALRRCLERYSCEGWPRIAGVVHAAGVVDDRRLPEMNEDLLARAFAPKAIGAWHLHRYFEQEELEFFVLFSSIASVVTSTGQTSYAAANAFLDALAHHRRSCGKPAISLNWGPWAVGMVKELDLIEHYRRRGMEPIGPELGLELLDRAWGQDLSQMALLAAHWPTVLEYYPRPPASFAHLAQEATADAAAAAEPVSVKEALAAAPSSEQLAIVTHELLRLVAKVLRIEPSRVDPEARLTFLGIDSMMATELRNRVEVGLGVTVPMIALLGDSSIATLATKVLADIVVTQSREPELISESDLERLVQATDEATLKSILDQVRELSDEQIELKLASLS